MMIPELDGFRVMAITTSKTSRAAGAKEYWLRDYENDAGIALSEARAEHPRKKKWFALYQKTNDPLHMIARQFSA